jgi:hypothetical protein
MFFLKTNVVGFPREYGRVPPKKRNIHMKTVVFSRNPILKKVHPCYQGNACVLQRTWLCSPKKCNNVLEDMVIFS